LGDVPALLTRILRPLLKSKKNLQGTAILEIQRLKIKTFSLLGFDCTVHNIIDTDRADSNMR
jgi:hypothetical protein